MDATTLPSRFEGAGDRIPRSLAELHGPATGVVELPVRLAWSGPADFDVADPGQRLTLYTQLLDCGQRHDIVRYVNPDLLLAEWPRIRRATSRILVALWESHIPALKSA